MTERDDLVLEHMKRFQAQMTRFGDMLGAVAADMRSMKQHMAGYMPSELNHDAEPAALKLRMERRLDLVD